MISKVKIMFLGMVFLALGGYLLFVRPSDKNVAIALKKIPNEERVFLDYFFRELMLTDFLAYVLYGTKPAALAGYFGPQYYFYRLFWISSKKDILFKKGFEIWKKYEHLFPHTNYILLHRKIDCQEDLFHVLLINKKRFLKEVEENLEDFKRVMGNQITPEIVLKKFITEEKSLYDTVNQHSALEGLLLGFGSHNSWLFYQRDILQNRNEDFQYVPRRVDLYQNDLDQINEQLEYPVHEKCELNFVSLPCFLYDSSHQETEEFLAKYKEQRKKFMNKYQKGDFLEETLKKLIS